MRKIILYVFLICFVKLVNASCIGCTTTPVGSSITTISSSTNNEVICLSGSGITSPITLLINHSNVILNICDGNIVFSAVDIIANNFTLINYAKGTEVNFRNFNGANATFESRDGGEMDMNNLPSTTRANFNVWHNSEITMKSVTLEDCNIYVESGGSLICDGGVHDDLILSANNNIVNKGYWEVENHLRVVSMFNNISIDCAVASLRVRKSLVLAHGKIVNKGQIKCSWPLRVNGSAIGFDMEEGSVLEFPRIGTFDKTNAISYTGVSSGCANLNSLSSNPHTNWNNDLTNSSKICFVGNTVGARLGSANPTTALCTSSSSVACAPIVLKSGGLLLTYSEYNNSLQWVNPYGIDVEYEVQVSSGGKGFQLYERVQSADSVVSLIVDSEVCNFYRIKSSLGSGVYSNVVCVQSNNEYKVWSENGALFIDSEDFNNCRAVIYNINGLKIGESSSVNELNKIEGVSLSKDGVYNVLIFDDRGSFITKKVNTF